MRRIIEYLPVICLVIMVGFVSSCARSETDPTVTVAAGSTSLPVGWVFYTSDDIQIGVPPDWTVEDPDTSIENSFSFRLPNDALFSISVTEYPICRQGTADSSAVQECMMNSIIDWNPNSEVKKVNSGEWSDGIHKGDFIEFVTNYPGNLNSSPRQVYSVRIIAPLSEKYGETLEAFYTREETLTISDEERGLISQAIASLTYTPEK